MDAISTLGLPRNFNKGEVFFKTMLDCRPIAAAQKTNAVRLPGQKYITPSIADYISGSPFVDMFKGRGMSSVLAKATVYGRAQTFMVDGHRHSVFGMNKELLGTDGSISYTAVSNKLKEENVNSEVREQRLGLYYNVLVASDFYDNATSLLFVLLQKYYKMLLHEKTVHQGYELVLPAHALLPLVKSDRATVAKKLVSIIRDHGNVGCADQTIHYRGLINAVMEYLNSISSDVVEAVSQGKIASADVEPFKHTVAVYRMYEYNDGHNKSGPKFGEQHGFINGVMLAPSTLHTVMVPQGLSVSTPDQHIPDTDRTLKVMPVDTQAIDCAGLSRSEFMFIMSAFKGNQRNTPFLIDQDVDLGIMRKPVRAFNYSLGFEGTHEISQSDALRAINKVVHNHKWHQELHNAMILIKYWLAQPATETLESHWWTYSKRALTLPRVGLMRAHIPALTKGVPVGITAEAIKCQNSLAVVAGEAIAASAMYNAAWYWAEYLRVYNVHVPEEFKRSLRGLGISEMHENERADALVSALIAKPVAVCNYSEMGTRWDEGLDEQKKVFVKFGKIDVPHLQDYGYTVVDDKVVFNQLVAPSCISLFIGLDTTLLAGTPYNTEFVVRPTMQDEGDEYYREHHDFHSLWHYGTIARWCGYDVAYRHPNRDGEHKLYAANGVSICMPPVPPKAGTRFVGYEYLRTTGRENVFSSPVDWMTNMNVKVKWTRCSSAVLQEPDWNARKCLAADTITTISDKIQFVPMGTVEYTSTIVCDYEPNERFFRVASTLVGVPLLGEVDRSVSLLPQEETVAPDTVLTTSAG